MGCVWAGLSVTEMTGLTAVKYDNYISYSARLEVAAGGWRWLHYTGFMLVIITPVITSNQRGVKVACRFLPVWCLACWAGGSFQPLRKYEGQVKCC